MSLPKRKNNINVYPGKELLSRRQELLDKITKSDSFLPDSILHDDLDLGMLEFVKDKFKVVSDEQEIPIIPRILTVQRWGELTNNWQFADEDNNMKLPFIGVIRKPDVQPGTNPVLQRTIPDRRNFHYATVKTWDGTQYGADVYKIPQPVPVDISYEVTIVCQKIRDLNRLNKIVLQRFSSRQAYTMVKGHYVPIVLERISDNSPIDTMDGRRFYLQTYEFVMLGFLIDPEEFEVKPAISRALLITEFRETSAAEKKYYNKSIETVTATFVGDGETTVFSVGETIGFLFYVAINGLNQQRDVDYYHIAKTSRVTFVIPPLEGSLIAISYYSARKASTFIDQYGKVLFFELEYFTYDGSSLIFTTQNYIDSILYVEINGLIDEDELGYIQSSDNQVTLLAQPVIGSVIGICYVR